MYKLEREDFPREFLLAVESAEKHIAHMGQESLRWIGGPHSGALAEHLSFALGNQLFFVFVEAADCMPFTRESSNLFIKVAREVSATPCVLPMHRHRGAYEPAHNGWGLIDPYTGKSIDPAELVSDELIEMSDWDLHDFGIQVVRRKLQDGGNQIQSWQSSLHFDPSIWFNDGSEKWVIVRSARYPTLVADRPVNIEELVASFSKSGARGYFASVGVANANDPFDLTGNNAMPLYRGHGLAVRFTGLEPL